MVAVFTLCFEDPFWIGFLESEDEDGLSVARHVFGAEPSNAELLSFMLHDFAKMPRSRESRPGSPSGGGQPCRPRGLEARRSAKRAQREAMREIARPPSTKAQTALSAALEKSKIEGSARSREERRAEAERRFQLRFEKRKKKRAGH